MRTLHIPDADGGTPPAAQTVLEGEKDLDKLKPAPALPNPSPVKPAVIPVKDEKWLESEISRTEDKLRTLREQKKSSVPVPVPVPIRRKTGWECEELV